MGDDLCVNACKVKSEAAVFGLHARAKGAAFSELYRGGGGVPVVRCCIPLQDVFWRCVKAPDGFYGSFNGGLYAKFHGAIFGLDVGLLCTS